MKANVLFSHRTLITVIVINIFIAMLLSNNILGQNNVSNTVLKKNDTCNLVSFSGKRVEQINYLNCVIRSSIKGYYLVLERSVDGINYLPFEIKKGQISPGNQLLQFSFIDDSSAITTTYKICAYIMSVTKNGEQKYLNVSQNLFGDSENTIVKINVSKNEDIQELTSSWR